MLTIRLQRNGTKNRANFRIVLAESYRSASKQALEVLGHYNPRSKEFGIKDEQRLKYWISKHVNFSPTVHNLFVENKILTTPKVKAWKPKKKEAAAEEKPTQTAVAATNLESQVEAKSTEEANTASEPAAVETK